MRKLALITLTFCAMLTTTIATLQADTEGRYCGPGSGLGVGGSWKMSAYDADGTRLETFYGPTYADVQSQCQAYIANPS